MTELSPETRAFLDVAARGDGPSDEDRARIRHKLAVQLGAAALATTTLAVAAQATATSTGSLSAAAASVAVGKASAGAGVGLLGKIALAAALAGAVSTTAVVVVRSTEPGTDKASSAAQIARKPSRSQPHASAGAEHGSVVPSDVAAQAVAVQVVAAPVPIVEQLETEPVSIPAVAKAKRERTAIKAPIPEQSVANMAEELVLLRQAQTALREGRSADALSISADHAARFPQGALHEERAAVEMLARCAQGAAGPTQLSSFLENAPESPLKARVREACKAEP